LFVGSERTSAADAHNYRGPGQFHSEQSVGRTVHFIRHGPNRKEWLNRNQGIVAHYQPERRRRSIALLYPESFPGCFGGSGSEWSLVLLGGNPRSGGNAYHSTQSGGYADQQIVAAVDLGHLRAR